MGKAIARLPHNWSESERGPYGWADWRRHAVYLYVLYVLPWGAGVNVLTLNDHVHDLPCSRTELARARWLITNNYHVFAHDTPFPFYTHAATCSRFIDIIIS